MIRYSQRMFALGLSLLVGLTTFTSAQAPLWLGDWYPTIEATLTYDSNINRSFDGDGEKSDFILEPALRFQRQTVLTDTTFAHYSGVIGGALHGKYNKLNYLAPGLDLGLRQLVGRATNPGALIASLAVKYEFHDQDMRFGAEANPRLEARFPLGEQATLGLFYEYDNRFASENPIYDRDGHTVGFTAKVAFNEQTALILGYNYRRGDVLVHQPREDLGIEIRGERLPLDTFKSRYDAVKFKDEETHNVQLGVRHALNLYTAIHAGLAYEEISAKGDSYPSMQFIFSVTHLL